jgi:hypothetical protein
MEDGFECAICQDTSQLTVALDSRRILFLRTWLQHLAILQAR